MTPADIAAARTALYAGAPLADRHPEDIPRDPYPFAGWGFSSQFLKFATAEEARSYASTAGLRAGCVKGRTVTVPAGLDAALVALIAAEGPAGVPS